MNFIVTGGGTGGHFYPAYIIYKKLEESNHNVFYVGSDYGIEKKLASEYNLNYALLKARGFIGKNVASKFTSILLNSYSIINALKLLIKNKADAVIATGGYVSLPILAASVILKKPIFIQEQNSYPGLTTRIFASKARVIFLAFENATKHLNKNINSFFVNTPVRNEFLNNYIEKKNTITVLGGSQGSKILNKIIKENLTFFENNNIILNWITGINFFKEYKKFASEKINVIEYSKDIFKLIGESEIVISRSGATSIAEYKMFNKKVLFIPFAAATHNHQYYNAISYAENWISEIIQEKNYKKENFQIAIKNLLNKKNAEKKLLPNPVEIIINEILKNI
jgi:UDP-N-acetylglucosamine--N-acetylmuramyl-(pentapeptide) pyrophosphoryl-undecaprenol N-acetylglucosamine transferase